MTKCLGKSLRCLYIVTGGKRVRRIEAYSHPALILYLSQLWTPVLPNYSELGYGIGSDLFHIAFFLGFEEFKYQSVGLKFALELFR